MRKSNTTIAREMRRYSQVDLAKEMGVTQQQISNWERGSRSPDRANVTALSKILDVDEAWIAGHPVSLAVPDHIANVDIMMPVIRTEEIPAYGALYVVLCDDVQPLAVLVGGGLVIVPRDWDATMPLSVAEISEYNERSAMRVAGGEVSGWVAPDGSPCVMLDGLPRAGWWVE